MKRREETRKYRFSDAHLVQLADALQAFATRDEAELLDYGVDPTDLSAIATARDAFDLLPTDEELTGDLIIATQAKQATMQVVREQMRQITERARLRWGSSDGRYRKFGSVLPSRQSDEELLRMGRRVGRVAEEYQADLTEEGVTPAMVTALNTTLNTLDQNIDAQADAISERDLAVDGRIRSGNDLYGLLSDLAARGKLCFESVNEAKYNDYVITPTGNANAQTVTGNVAADSVVNLSVTGIEADTTLYLHNTGAVPLTFFFAAQPTDTEGPTMLIVAPGTVEEVAASALGYDEDLRFRLNVFNASAGAGAYLVEWI